MSVYFEPENIDGCLIGNAWEVCGYVGESSIVTVPASCKIGKVREVGSEAFQGNTKIEKVIVPNTVKWIGRNAFAGCANLREVILPDTVDYIGENAFADCPNLRKFTCGVVKTIGKNAFSNCRGLVDENGFFAVKNKLVLYLNVREEIVVPEHITDINEEVFLDRQELRFVSLPRNLRHIGKKAFSGCTNLIGINIPENLESLDRGAFDGCKGLYQGQYLIVDDWLIDCIRSRSITEITIPELVTNIADFAFYRNFWIEKVKIPGHVRRIGTSAFDHCGNLRHIIMEDGLEHIGTQAFAETKLLTVKLPESVRILGSQVFRNCKYLVSADLGKGIRQMDTSVFEDCINLLDVNIPETMTSIPAGMFKNCRRLRGITIPEGVIQINKEAFSGCHALETLILPESLVMLQKEVFAHCRSLKNLRIPKNTKTIQETAFFNCGAIADENGLTILNGKVCGYCGDGVTLVIPEGVTEVIDSAFFQYEHLFAKPIQLPNHQFKKLVLPEGLISIGAWAFCQCEQLEEVVFPDSLERIGERAFQDCKNLQKPELGSKVVCADYAFRGCRGDDWDQTANADMVMYLP